MNHKAVSRWGLARTLDDRPAILRRKEARLATEVEFHAPLVGCERLVDDRLGQPSVVIPASVQAAREWQERAWTKSEAVAEGLDELG